MDIKYNIIFTKMAKQDLMEIYKYISEKLKEPQIATKLMGKIEKKVSQLQYNHIVAWKYILNLEISCIED